jgi:NAD+ synthase (glutamine-hydrolysing)
LDLRVALVQFNPTVGDLEGNSARMIALAKEARQGGADLVVFSELCVVGYPPMDLLERHSFIDATAEAVDWVIRRFPKDTGVIFGAPITNRSGSGKPLLNAALLAENGETIAVVAKQKLPTYDVFDESRYFERGGPQEPVHWRNVKLGIHICEDMWERDPVCYLGDRGADVFINISASPFATGKIEERDEIMLGLCQKYDKPFLYANQVGANTEILFDGSSTALSGNGNLQVALRPFVEEIGFWDTSLPSTARPDRDDIDDVLDALVMGVRDYVEKTDAFEKVVVGLSGGIDSAVTCALATLALGPDRVMGLTMPSRFSSPGSISDSEELAANLGIACHEIPISPAVDAFTAMLQEMFEGTTQGVAEENIQARARGLTLMAVCNKFNYLLLTTGNKSELATGYATLYGDMSGGLAVLSDVFKTQVYELAHRINERLDRVAIPETTITKPPSAELRPDQQDTDSLPPYDVLDPILKCYIEDGLDDEDIVEQTGEDWQLIRDIIRMVDRNEYKRRQAAPGLRISKKAFGVGRRMPIVMRYSEVASDHMVAP